MNLLCSTCTCLRSLSLVAVLGLGGQFVPLRGEEHASSPEAGPPRTELHLKLLNQDAFPFEFKTFSKGFFVGKPAWSPQDLRIPANAVGFLDIPAEPPAPAFTPTHSFVLSNGSEMNGRIVEAAERLVQVETLWGQKIQIRPDMVLSMERVPAAADVMVRAVLPLSQWTSDASANIGAQLLPRNMMGQGILLSNGNSLQKDIGPLPERFVITLRFVGSARTQFTLILEKQDRANNQRFAGLSLNLSPTTMIVRGKSKNTSQNFKDLVEGLNSLRFFVDRKSAKIWMEVNGVLQDGLALPDSELAGPVRLTLRSQVADLLLESIRMEAWDGLFSLEMPSKALPSGKVRVRLNNGDILDAEWLALDPSQLRIKRGNGEELALSLELVREIRSSPASLTRPRRNARDVFVFLHDAEGPICLELSALNPDYLEGTSEAIEEPLQIPLRHVRRIEFNPYRQRVGEDSGVQVDWPSLWDK